MNIPKATCGKAPIHEPGTLAVMTRYAFTPEMLEQYFDRIAIPKTRRVHDVSNLTDLEQMDYLKLILKHHLVRIPFENLVQHYSWHRVIDVAPLHIFRKVVDQPGRGGYCMEANNFLHSALYSLGFDCYLGAGRVWNAPESRWTGWSHLVNLVTIAGSKYLCDVGFGSNEPTVPILLRHEETAQQIGSARSKLVYQRLDQYLSDSKAWVYMFRTDDNADWMALYCFTETEILPSDIAGLNYSPWLSPYIHFTQKVVCVRQTTEREVDDPGLASGEAIDQGELDGSLIIDHDKFKWRRHGETVLSRDLASEEDRLDVLRRYFGIDLDIEDQQAIVGTVAAIAPKH